MGRMSQERFSEYSVFHYFSKNVIFLTSFVFGSSAIFLFHTALAEEPIPADFAGVEKKLQQVTDIKVLLETCPADIKGTRQTWRHWLFGHYKGWNSKKCKKKLDACTIACVETLNRSACAAVARVLEKDGMPDYDVARRQAFALACALGSATGCTNRGASIRNAKAKTDQISQHEKTIKERCLMRTFVAACADGDAWGCAMEGQAHRLGQGGPVDFEKARTQYIRACALSPKLEKKESERAPCRFSRRQLKYLTQSQ